MGHPLKRSALAGIAATAVMTMVIMNTFRFIAVAALLIASAVTINAQQRVVLADVFTNSHCGPCAAMHGAFEEQVTRTLRGSRVVEIYHHAPVYLDDELYRHNTVEPMQRASYLGGISGTPTVFIGGVRVRGSWSGLGTAIDDELNKPSVVSIEARVTIEESEVVSRVTIKKVSAELSNVSLYAAVVEDVAYKGRNGVIDRHNVFRRGLTPAGGLPLTFDETGVANYELRLPMNEVWDLSKLSAVIAVQQTGNGVVHEAVEQQIEVVARVDDQIKETMIDEVAVYTLNGERQLTITGPFADLSTALRGRGLKGATIVVLRRGDRYQSQLMIDGSK